MEIDRELCLTLAQQFVDAKGGGIISGELGAGGTSLVFRWQHPEEIRALKIYDPSFLASSAGPAERYRLDLQRRLIGHHCPSLIDTLAVDEALGTCFVTMEYFPGFELKKTIGKVPDEAVPSLIRQLVDAVIFLESFGLVHRDIKPENILVSGDFDKLKLLDLGVLREISAEEDRIDGTDHGLKKPFIATAQYSSPEYLFRLEPPSASLWRALTIYQVGAVLHDLVCKRPLFETAVVAENKYALAMSVMRDPPDFSGAAVQLSSWTALAARCLTKDSTLRQKLVTWDDFYEVSNSARTDLRRALAARAASSDRAVLDEVQARTRQQARRVRLAEVVDDLRNQLIADFSPHLRVSKFGATENRLCLYLKLVDIALGVYVAIECSWDSGVKERIGAVRLAAKAACDQEQTEVSGERRSIGQIELGGSNKELLVAALAENITNILLKHSELADIGALSEGDDLVALCWLNTD